MNCTDFMAKLTDYFDGQIDPDLMAEVKEHLSSCHHCEVVVDTTSKTIDVYREHEPYDFPASLADRLRNAVMERCKKLGKYPDVEKRVGGVMGRPLTDAELQTLHSDHKVE